MSHVTLSLDALTAALRWQGIDEPHNALVSELAWLSDEARHEVDERARIELTQRGLARQGELDLRLATALRGLARPHTEVSGWLVVRAARISVLAATAGSDGTLVSRNNETVQISALPSADLAQVVGAQLPAAPVGQGRALSVREADYTGERQEPQSEGFEGFVRPQENPDVHALRSLMARPRVGGGQLVAAWRDRSGKRLRSAETLSYVDTVDGRWATYPSTDHSGQRWIHAVPGAPQVMVGRLRELLGGAR